MQKSRFSTWLEIDLSAIQNNIQRLAQISGKPVISVVKANGYGHGIVEVGQAAVAAGSPMLAVARIEEALVLRNHSIDYPILVMGYTRPDQAAMAVEKNIRLALYDWETACAYASAARPTGGVLKIHVKIDTGMGRLGLFPEEGVDFIKKLFALPEIEVDGLFTHFARADEPEHAETYQQIESFNRVILELISEGIRPAWVHAANSAAAVYFPQAAYDAVRCGIAIYGLHPSSKAPLPDGFRPAMTWKTRLASVKTLPAGRGVSYGHRYTTSKSENIGVIAAGYADGLRRLAGNVGLVNGQRVEIVGTICMDQAMIQLDGIPGAKIGDEVVLLGGPGEEAIRAEELAEAWGTINYEVVCGMAARIPRFYIE